MNCTNYSSGMVKEGDPSTPFPLRFVVLKLTPEAGRPRYCMRKDGKSQGLPRCRTAPRLPNTDAAVMRPGSSARSRWEDWEGATALSRQPPSTRNL